jgi:tetratricopeptide (TPR) repeat protein
MTRIFLLMIALQAAPVSLFTAEEFSTGVAALQAGNLTEAKNIFENQIQTRPSAGALVNLGNIEWQSGHAGAAILAWERAAWIDPFDKNAKQNLDFAREAAQVEAPELRWFESASLWLPPDAWVWLAGAGLWLAVGVLVLPRVLRWKKSGGQQTLAAFGLCVFLFSLTANFGVVSRTNLGFVVKKNVALRLTPTSGSELISTLISGEPVRRITARENYLFIRTATASGWVERGQVGFINE